MKQENAITHRTINVVDKNYKATEKSKLKENRVVLFQNVGKLRSFCNQERGLVAEPDPQKLLLDEFHRLGGIDSGIPVPAKQNSVPDLAEHSVQPVGAG